MNEIVWCYSTSGRSKKFFAKKHDIILLYAKSNKARWTDYRIPLTPKYLATHYRHHDAQGRQCRIRTDHGKTRIYYPEDGMICNDWWEIPYVNSQAKERLGYPTQKPLALLERIVKASSNEGDIVLDPFCGCGTTVEAAKNLNRQFVGVDISSFAIDLVRDRRLNDHSIPVYGIPQDLRSAAKLAKEKPFDFESWAITRLPGFVPNTKQVADGGIDGRAKIARKPDNWDSKDALAQVKGGKFSLSGLRDFIGVTDRKQAALGCYVTLNPVKTPSAREVISELGKISVDGYPYPRMQTWSIQEYFDDRRPRLPVMNDPYTGKSMEQYDLFS